VRAPIDTFLRTRYITRRVVAMALLAATFAPDLAGAQVLATYPFTANTNPAFVDPAITTSFNRSSLFFSIVFDDGYGNVLQAYPSPGSTSAATALANNSFYTIRLQSTGGGFFSLDTLSFESGKGGAASPRGDFLRASTDGFRSNLFSELLPQVGQPPPAPKSIRLNRILFHSLTDVTFRFYVFTPDPLEQSVDYRNMVFSLTGTRSFNTFPSRATTTNQLAVAQSLEASIPSAAGEFRTLLAQLDDLSVAQNGAAFESLSGVVHAGIASSLLQDSNNFFTNLERQMWVGLPDDGNRSQRTAQLRPALSTTLVDATAPLLALGAVDAAPVSVPTGGFRLPGVNGWSGWVHAQGFDSRLRTDGNAPTIDVRARGAIFGADHPWGRDGVYGFAGSYMDIDPRLAGGSVQSADIDSYRLGGYASKYFRDRWYGTGILSYAHNEIRTDRTLVAGGVVGQAHARYDGDSVGAFAEAGRSLECGDYVFRPHGLLQYNRAELDAFQETAPAGLGLSSPKHAEESFIGGLGVWVTRSCSRSPGKRVRPELRLRWLHEFDQLSQTATVAFAGASALPFTVRSPQLGRDSAQVGIGVTSEISDQLALFCSYDGRFGSHLETHAAQVGARFAW
jgi:outer membrane autotransporter protein